MKKNQSFLSENFQFLEVKFSIYLNRRVFVTTRNLLNSYVPTASGIQEKQLDIQNIVQPSVKSRPR